jgi:ATP-dependent Clp protease adaptor protein ClpS
MTITDTTIELDKVTKVVMRPPSKFNVILFNDDTTTMEFVILILMTLFHKGFEDATALTSYIHKNGRGIAGVYTHEIAVQKRDETILAAKANHYPLRCEIEEV